MADPTRAPLAVIERDYNSAAADTDAYANDVNASSGNPFTLAATAPLTDDLAHKVIITPSGSVTGNYTITGTGPQGEAQTETLATDGANAVTSVKYYRTLTEVLAPSGIGAETVDIGFTAASVSAWVPCYRGNAVLNFGCAVVSGSPNYSVQHCFDKAGEYPFTHATVSGETTSQEGSYTGPIQALRLIFTAAGRVALTGLQG